MIRKNNYVLKMMVVVAICVVAVLGKKIASKADSLSSTADAETQINKLIEVASNEVGYKESESGWTKYGQWWTDRTGDNAYATANWSCMFLSWCGREAGIAEEDYGYYSYTGYWLNWFKENSAYYDSTTDYKPSAGDIVFLDNNGDDKVDTVAIVEKKLWTKISIIKGNTNGETKRCKIKPSDSSILGYGVLFNDSRNKEVNKETEELEEPLVGIDVSSYNGDIDWQQVKTSGIDFSYIRLGYRGYSQRGTLVMDKNFTTNIQGALNAGINVGVYFVTQAITVEEAIEEADYVLSKVSGYNITYPIAIDTEQANENERSKDLTKDERTEIIKAFCDRIEEAGYKSQIYSGKYWFYDKLNMDKLDGYDIWVAEYVRSNNVEETSFQYPYSIWQYTDSGRVLGISTVVDMNKCYVNYIQPEGGIKNWLKNFFE